MSSNESSKIRLKVGHTAITWPDEKIEDAIVAISNLGFCGIEVFGWILAKMEEENKLDLFEKYKLPLISSYFSLDIVNRDKKEEELKKLRYWGRILKDKGGKWVTLGGNSIDRRRFNFSEHKKYIIDFVNEAGKILLDSGLILAFHPHTNTPVESKNEINEFMYGVDTRYVGFAPDVGQIQKGGADPAEIVEEFLPVVKIVHLKDFCGKVSYDDNGKEIDISGYCCYTPLGHGVVDIPRILRILEQSSFNGYIMVELDRGEKMPLSAEEAAAINKKYLEKLLI